MPALPLARDGRPGRLTGGGSEYWPIPIHDPDLRVGAKQRVQHRLHATAIGAVVVEELDNGDVIGGAGPLGGYGIVDDCLARQIRLLLPDRRCHRHGESKRG